MVFPMPTVITSIGESDGESGESNGESDGESQLSKRQRIILSMISANGFETARHIASVIGVGQRTVDRDISFLRKNGFIDKSTKDTRSPWVVLKGK